MSDKRLEGTELSEEALESVVGGGRGGKPGCCPGCGGTDFTSLSGDKIRCNSCGWEGTRTSISA